MRFAPLAVVLAACTNAAPTWRDAAGEWAAAWCDNTAECAPEYFARHYVDRADCVGTETGVQCARLPCDERYPDERRAALADCAARMAALPCGSILPPDSCFAALEAP